VKCVYTLAYAKVYGQVFACASITGITIPLPGKQKYLSILFMVLTGLVYYNIDLFDLVHEKVNGPHLLSFL